MSPPKYFYEGAKLNARNELAVESSRELEAEAA